MEVLIPDKLYFKIGEVALITSLRPSVLRFWETEFASLSPVKSSSGQRLYTRKELELILEIKNLLYYEKLTIEGARKRFTGRGKKKELSGSESTHVPDTVTGIIKETIQELKEIRNSL